jgi:hypothetical protein
MVRAQAILVVTVVDCDFNGDGCVNEANDGGGNANVVGVAAVCSAGEAVVRSV